MKKIISLTIVLALCFAFASTALAEPVRPVEFTLDAEVSNANQLIVTVSLSENSGVASGVFNINFEKGVLNFVNYIKTDLELGIPVCNGPNDGRVRVIFFATPILIEGGEMLKLVFDFVDPAFIGEIDFGLEITELLEPDTAKNDDSESAGCTRDIAEHQKNTEPAKTPQPKEPELVRRVEFTTYAEISNANQLIVTISGSEKGGFSSGVLRSHFEKGLLKYVKLIKTDIELGLVNSNGSNDGIVAVSFANTIPMNEGGEIFRIVFDFVDPAFIGTINFNLEIKELIEVDTVTKIETEATGYAMEITEHPEITEPAITAPPTSVPANTPKQTDEPTSYPPDDEYDVDSTYAPTTPVTGGMTLIAIAAFSAMAGVGALTLRKKD